MFAPLSTHAADDRKPAPAPPGAAASKPGAATKPSAPAKASDPQKQQSELRREQQALQLELGKLKRQLAATETTRSTTTDALAKAEIAISNVSRRLRELGAERQRVERQIAALAAREHDASSRQDEQQRRRDALLRQMQRLTLRDPLHLLVEGDDPNELGRDELYLAYLGRQAQESVGQLQMRRAELSDLQQQSEQKRSELAVIEVDESGNRQLLRQEQQQRKRTLDQLAKQAESQRQTIARLERDDARLSTLIDRITALLDEQRRREEAARQRAERESARTARPASTPKPGGAPPPAVAAVGTGFAQQRGRLSLPVQGSVATRFGASRTADGGMPSSKGIFIRAAEGADVRSVGDGQIVFADWLRGFGNLLVIDHGEGYLSIYGNNEALLRNVGDKVAVGEVVASVGNTGGNEAPGLYFELRFQGRPFDPLTWVAAR
jgi:septal ring factor EnvC (AmiA/AmiB activator)